MTVHHPEKRRGKTKIHIIYLEKNSLEKDFPDIKHMT